ncbi:unnamed protein product [Tilletia caries]|nr:unnamed protein product [Tilletia caries]
MLEDTRPSLEDMCQEFNLCAGEQIVTDNAGNAAHLILRAVAYMSTRNPIHHANGGPAADNPQDKIARLRALATTLLPTSLRTIAHTPTRNPIDHGSGGPATATSLSRLSGCTLMNGRATSYLAAPQASR